MNIFFTWFPRGLSILITLFVFSFIIDVVGDSFQWYMPLIAALPGVIFLIVTLVAWRWPFTGGIIWLALGASYAYQYFVRYAGGDWLALVVMCGVPIVVGVLLIVGHLIKLKTKKPKK